jgi:hypothetical protein
VFELVVIPGERTQDAYLTRIVAFVQQHGEDIGSCSTTLESRCRKVV